MSCVREMHLLFLLPSLLLFQPLKPCSIFVLSGDFASEDPQTFVPWSSFIAAIICHAAGKLLRFGRKGKGVLTRISAGVFHVEVAPQCLGFLSSLLCDPRQAVAPQHNTHKRPAWPAFCRDSLFHLLPENQELPHAASNEMKTDINPSAKPQHVT